MSGPALCASTPPDAVTVSIGDQRILSLGGTQAGQPVDFAVVYDSLKRTCRPAGRMCERRAGHTATRLPDGRVLIAGGGTRSLEVFDPKTIQWTAVPGKLSVARSFHIAALLRDGTVLISGGKDGGTALDSSEIYDPVFDSVRPAAVLAVPRYGHSATVLLDGKVLIGGGSGLASSEIYDPERDSFAGGGAMATSRTGHLAIRLPDNNEVLLVGGRGPDGEPIGSAEVYDPSAGAFQPRGLDAQVRCVCLRPNGGARSGRGGGRRWVRRVVPLPDSGRGFERSIKRSDGDRWKRLGTWGGCAVGDTVRRQADYRHCR